LVALRNGVTNVDEVAPVVVASGDPPVEFAYQRKVPVTPVDALILTVPGLHEIPSVPVTVVAVPTVPVTAILEVVQAGDVEVKET
jgi:hypothetical protein